MLKGVKMRYFGGKARTAKEICAVIRSLTNGISIYEPFCGGLSITAELSQYFRCVTASDINKPIISLYEYVQNWGTDWIPTNITKEDYEGAKSLDDADPLKAFILVGCAFSGIYGEGFARSGDRNYASNAKNSLRRKFKKIEQAVVIFENKEYTEYSYVQDSVFYCDPPYDNTRCGYIVKKFDSVAFWEWILMMAKQGNQMFISEYNAPDFAKCVWEKEVKTDMHGKGREGRVEKLFLVGQLL